MILGAGASGLSAGWKLAQGGAEVTIIEKEPYVGGLGASIERGGAFFDFGPHTFFLDDDLVDEFYQVIKREEVNVFKVSAKIKFGNKYYFYPLDALDILIKLNPLVALKCLFDYFIASTKMKIRLPVDDSAESWIINRFGKSLYQTYFETYTEKVWGLHPKFIASSFTEERIPLLSLREAFQSAFTKIISRLLKGELSSKRQYLKWGYYPNKGSGAFYNKLANKILSLGGTIHLNSNLKGVVINKHILKAISFEKDQNVETVDCDSAVSTIPLSDLINKVTPSPDNFIINASNSLRFRALVFVNLLVKKCEIFEGRMTYFYNKTFNRISELNKFSDTLVPEGLTGLCAEITCDKGNEIWNADEPELCGRIIKELETEGLISKNDVMDAFVTRKEYGYPVADLNYEKNRKILFDFIMNTKNLYVTGRQGLFRYLQMDHCIKKGFSLAEHILSNAHKKDYIPTALNNPPFI